MLLDVGRDALFAALVTVGLAEREDGIEGIGALVGAGDVLEGDGLERLAPACVGQYEDLMAIGSKRLILKGNCGVLDKSIEDCGIIVPTMAIRDEGTSYHYAKPSDTIPVNKKYREEFFEVLKECGYPYVEGTTWTTDACYRETRAKVLRRKQQGAVCVEMECAGMQAVCDFRGTEFFQFFYAGDNLDHSSWEPRSISGETRLDDKMKILFLAFELGIKIMKKCSGSYDS